MTRSSRDTPAFTIIVPTRERRDTLEKTLLTCFDQDYERLEVLVCDNFSQDDTAEYLRSVDDPRLRVISTGQRLSMATNWEFALSHAARGFVMVLGDDDGMLPKSVRPLVDALDAADVDAAAWNQGIYTWPDCGRGKPDNRLKLPLHREACVRDAGEALQTVVDCKASYKGLPSLYWGVLHTDVIDRARASSGRFVHAVNPDVYSAVASSMVVDRYLYFDGPFSLIGLSRHSTGVSFCSGQVGEDTQLAKFFREVDLDEHEAVPMIPSPFAYTAEAYMHARDNVPGGGGFPLPDFARLLERVVAEAAVGKDAVYPQLVEGCRKLAVRHGLERELDRLLERHPRQEYVHHEGPMGLNVLRNSMKIDCTEVGVTNVHEASVLSHYLLALYERGYISPGGVLRSTLDRASTRLALTAKRGKALLGLADSAK